MCEHLPPPPPHTFFQTSFNNPRQQELQNSLKFHLWLHEVRIACVTSKCTQLYVYTLPESGLTDQEVSFDLCQT